MSSCKAGHKISSNHKCGWILSCSAQSEMTDACDRNTRLSFEGSHSLLRSALFEANCTQSLSSVAPRTSLV